MPKRMILKPTNGFPLLTGIATTSPATGNSLVSTQILTSVNTITIDFEHTDVLYKNYVKPFVYENPLYMGSIDKLVSIYNSIDKSLELIADENKPLTLLLRDTILVLIRTNCTYYEFIRSENELKEIEKKYKQALVKINELENKIKQLTAEDKDGQLMILEGELGITIKQPKNLIYAQALLNLDYAWYQYLHKTKKIEPKLYYSTKQYVKSLGEKKDAYNKLIEILDKKYQSLKEDIDEENTEN